MSAPTLAIAMMLSMHMAEEADAAPFIPFESVAVAPSAAREQPSTISAPSLSEPSAALPDHQVPKVPTPPGTTPDAPSATGQTPDIPAVTPTLDAAGTDAAGTSTTAGEEDKEDEEDAIVISGKQEETPGDPLEQVNAKSFEVVQSVDKALVGPVAMAYKEKLPSPIRKGLRNFISNLTEPLVFVNYLLQFKPGKAAETVGRFAINTTLGVAGLFDTAKKKPFNLPYRSNGFANTMGYYGVKPGAYLYLPFMGSTTVRDLFGRGLDLLFFPVVIGKPFTQPAYTLSIGTIDALDDRAEFEDEMKRLRDESDDPYKSFREYYLQKREAEIDALHGLYRAVPIAEEIPLFVTPEPLSADVPPAVAPLSAGPVADDVGTPALSATSHGDPAIDDAPQSAVQQ